MKHKHSHRTLGRSADQRRKLLQGLSASLLEHRSVVTTAARAKELRRFFEPLVTEAKREVTLHRRRQLLRKLRRKGDLLLLLDMAKMHRDRPGGYLRITRLPTGRGDAAALVRVDMVE